MRQELAPVVPVSARFTVNAVDLIDETARSGLGVAMLRVLRCIEHLRTKRLKRVLPESCSPEFALHAVDPSTRRVSPKVKASLDRLRELLTPLPWESGPTP